MNKQKLQQIANEVRKGIVTSVHSAKAGHPGGSLSAADLFTYLYFEEMNIDPENPKDPKRDRFVLSKGHTAPGLYATLAHRGYFPVTHTYHAPADRLHLAGTSGYETHPRRGYVQRFPGAGRIRCRWHGTCGKIKQGVLPHLYPAG